MNFQTIVSQFLGETDPSKIGSYFIHLERAKERLPVMAELEEKLGTKIPIFSAADGYELFRQGYPHGCAHTEGSTRGEGDVGCTVSHAWVARDAMAKGYEYAIVFEDDCIMKQELVDFAYYMEMTKMYLQESKGSWDLFLLGNSAHLNFEYVTPFLAKVRDFYGTHALIMKRSFMEHLLSIFDEAHSRGKVHSADGLYSTVLKTRPVTAFGCAEAEHFFEQKKGMYSYIVEKVR